VKNRVSSDVWAVIKDAIKQAHNNMEDEQHDEGNLSHNKRARPHDSNDDISDSHSDCDSSSEESGSFGGTSMKTLPHGIPSWVLTDTVIPNQFSRSNYSKAYSLKSYEMTRPLQKELKKLRKWWTKERNAERKGAKSVQDETADKREERVLCFLGFIQRYKCLPSDDLVLTLALFLSHRLFELYLNYLKQVRESSDGTIGEAITSAISAYRWLYRKESSASGFATPQIIRRYMDYRNIIRRKRRKRVRKMMWTSCKSRTNGSTGVSSPLSLPSFAVNGTTISRRTSRPVSPPRSLCDLLLLGLYSCVPGRGAEVRLLQYIPEQDIIKQWQLHRNMTMKKWANKQKINLITRTAAARGTDEESSGVWKMYVSQYKNYRSRGVDVTELTSSNFGWWTNLLQSYLETYRPLSSRRRHQPNRRRCTTLSL
jgi:hypothetical protein